MCIRDSSSAVELARNNRFDLLILDVMMPAVSYTHLFIVGDQDPQAAVFRLQGRLSGGRDPVAAPPAFCFRLFNHPGGEKFIQQVVEGSRPHGNPAIGEALHPGHHILSLIHISISDWSRLWPLRVPFWMWCTRPRWR